MQDGNKTCDVAVIVVNDTIQVMNKMFVYKHFVAHLKLNKVCKYLCTITLLHRIN